MTADPAPPRWLIIVRRGRHDLYLNLRQSFESDTLVDVILDRRRGDRRVNTVPVGTERRRQQRRTPLTAKDLAFKEHAGFFLIYRSEAP